MYYLFRKISENGREGQRVAYDGAKKRPADGWRTTDESRRHNNDVHHRNNEGYAVLQWDSGCFSIRNHHRYVTTRVLNYLKKNNYIDYENSTAIVPNL